MNPDTLRALADEVDSEMVFRYEHQRRMRRHAAAWETEVKDWEDAYYERDRAYNVLVKRLEEIAAQAYICLDLGIVTLAEVREIYRLAANRGPSAEEEKT